jgi:hypothetical protein
MQNRQLKTPPQNGSQEEKHHQIGPQEEERHRNAPQEEEHRQILAYWSKHCYEQYHQ